MLSCLLPNMLGVVPRQVEGTSQKSVCEIKEDKSCGREEVERGGIQQKDQEAGGRYSFSLGFVRRAMHCTSGQVLGVVAPLTGGLTAWDCGGCRNTTAAIRAPFSAQKMRHCPNCHLPASVETSTISVSVSVVVVVLLLFLIEVQLTSNGWCSLNLQALTFRISSCLEFSNFSFLDIEVWKNSYKTLQANPHPPNRKQRKNCFSLKDVQEIIFNSYN